MVRQQIGLATLGLPVPRVTVRIQSASDGAIRAIFRSYPAKRNMCALCGLGYTEASHGAIRASDGATRAITEPPGKHNMCAPCGLKYTQASHGSIRASEGATLVFATALRQTAVVGPGGEMLLLLLLLHTLMYCCCFKEKLKIGLY